MYRLNKIGITIYDNKKEEDYILIKIKIDDYDKIKKYLISYCSYNCKYYIVIIM